MHDKFDNNNDKFDNCFPYHVKFLFKHEVPTFSVNLHKWKLHL